MTITVGTSSLLSILSTVMLNHGYSAQQEREIREIGQAVYDEAGASGMREVYSGCKKRLPALSATLSKLWDGVGDWAD